MDGAPSEQTQKQILKEMKGIFPGTDDNILLKILSQQKWSLGDSVNYFLELQYPSSNTASTNSKADLPVPPPPIRNASLTSNASSTSATAPIHTMLMPPPPLVMLPQSASEQISAMRPLGLIGFQISMKEFNGKSDDQIIEMCNRLSALGSPFVIPLTFEDDYAFNRSIINVIQVVQRTQVNTIVSLMATAESSASKVLKGGGMVHTPSFKRQQVGDAFIQLAVSVSTAAPAFICLYNEVNVFSLRNPTDFQSFVAAYKTAYREIKKVSPQTRVFVSFNYELLNSRKQEHQKMVAALKPELDLIAITSFPGDVFASVSQMPPNYYKTLSDFADGLNIGILEIGWPSEGGQASEAEQRDFIVKLPMLLSECAGVSPVWTCWTDYQDTSQRSMGFVKADGKPKASRIEWEQYHAKVFLTKALKPSPRQTPNAHARKPSGAISPPPPLPQAVASLTNAPATSNPPDISKISLSQSSNMNKSGSSEQLSNDFFKSVESVTREEVEAIVLERALEGLLRRPSYSKIQDTDMPNLISSKIALEAFKRVVPMLDEARIPSMLGGLSNSFNAFKLNELVLSVLDECTFRVLNDSSWQDSARRKYKNAPSRRVQVCEDQGPRPYMEDRQVNFEYLDVLVGIETLERVSFYAVFDGHGGAAAAEYVATHLHVNIMRSQSFPSDIKQALREGFKTTNDRFFAYVERKGLPLNVGATAVVVFIFGNQLYVGWVGDSEVALLKTTGDVLKFVTCHKASSESEQQRVKQAGGYVQEVNGMMRVNGLLAVSRAFGDKKLHPFVNAEPEISSYTLSGGELYLVLGCDGLWDVVSAFDLDDLLTEYKNSHGQSIDGAARALGKISRDRGSTDNVTVVLLSFQNEK